MVAATSRFCEATVKLVAEQISLAQLLDTLVGSDSVNGVRKHSIDVNFHVPLGLISPTTSRDARKVGKIMA